MRGAFSTLNFTPSRSRIPHKGSDTPGTSKSTSKGHSCYPPASQRVGSVNTQEGRGCSVVVQTVRLPKCAAAHLPREKGRLGIASFLLFLLFGARGHLCRFELVWRQPGLQMKFRYRLTSQAVMQRLPPGAGVAVLGFFLIASEHARVRQLCTWSLPPAHQPP